MMVNDYSWQLVSVLVSFFIFGMVVVIVFGQPSHVEVSCSSDGVNLPVNHSQFSLNNSQVSCSFSGDLSVGAISNLVSS